MASINIVMPLFLVLGAFGFMLGTGGSAEVAKTMGEGRDEDAKSYFTNLTLAVAVLGVALTLGTVFFFYPPDQLFAGRQRPADRLLRGVWHHLPDRQYSYMLQAFFQAFFITAEKPRLGMLLTIASGLDQYGAGLAVYRGAGMGHCRRRCSDVHRLRRGRLLPLIYFARKNSGRLQFVRLKLHWRMLGHSAVNGSSEMVSNASRALTTFLFNIQLMRLVGEDGVSAITVMQYVNFVFIAVMIGFSVGVAPVVGFHYGAKNTDELKGCSAAA